jgi:acylphosphatase
MPTSHYLIKGQVQGVYFRASAQEVANAMGLTGWVRNTPEGNVEAVATGDEHSLREFGAWCRQGPPAAIVSEVEIKHLPEQAYADFSVIR